MFTLSYPFRPWRGSRAIADGPAILDYLRDTAREHGIEDAIRFNSRVVAAEWSSDDARWTVEVEGGERLTCGFLFTCTGYYRYDEGYTPEFAGIERFGGEIVHPQFWPEDVDYAGKRVVVIGSGATAVTMIPALAERAAHVTMLQRSPSYVISLPAMDPIAGLLERVLPDGLSYRFVRWKNVRLSLAIYGLSRRRPAAMRRLIRNMNKRLLPPGFDVDTHFNPSYDPWDQRMCIVPDADLFEAIGAGSVSVVTDRIETFTETGLAARVRRPARGRPDRHRDRAEDGPVRRHPAERRRRGRRARPRARLPRDAAQRRAEHGVRVRLHEPVVDARIGPHRRAGLPPPPAHGPPWLRDLHAAPRPGRRRRAVRRSHVGLRAARDRRVAQAGRGRPLAPRAALRAQPPRPCGATRSTVGALEFSGLRAPAATAAS